MVTLKSSSGVSLKSGNSSFIYKSELGLTSTATPLSHWKMNDENPLLEVL